MSGVGEAFFVSCFCHIRMPPPPRHQDSCALFFLVALVLHTQDAVLDDRHKERDVKNYASNPAWAAFAISFDSSIK
jgi:hypothetical protein